MAVAFQVTAEGENIDHALQNLKEIVAWLERISLNALAETYPHNGTAFPVSIPPGNQIGSVCIEDDDRMNGRLRLRRVGPPKPAFDSRVVDTINAALKDKR